FRFFRLTRSSSVPKRRFPNASTGIGLLQLRMERRMKSAVTVSNAAVKELGREDAPRGREFIRLSPLGRGRLASSASKSGEGGRSSISNSYPVTPTLSPSGRGSRCVARTIVYAPPRHALRIGERSDAVLRTAMGGRGKFSPHNAGRDASSLCRNPFATGS